MWLSGGSEKLDEPSRSHPYSVTPDLGKLGVVCLLNIEYRRKRRRAKIHRK